MTAITHRLAAADSELLRFALRADATLCAGLGLLTAVAADPLSRLTGLSATAEWIGGAALVAYGVALYCAARITDIRRVGIAVVLGNVLFVAAVAVALVTGALPLTRFGVTAAVTFTAATVVLTWLQYLGARRLA